MSAYSTRTITREEAERMVEQCRAKKDRSVKNLTIEELNRELHEYVYSENYREIVGFLENYRISDKQVI